MPRRLTYTILLGSLAFFGCFLLWPVAQILRAGFVDANGSFTLAYVGAVLGDPIYRAGLANSFLLAAATTTLSILIGVPLAFVSDRYEFPGKALLSSLILLPMVMPPFVGAIGIKQVFGEYGAVNALLWHLGWLARGETIDWFGHARFWGIALVQAFSLYPIVYLNAVSALANVDPAMEEAAANLGCTGWRRFRRITLPLIAPGVFAGATLAFIWAFTELGVPLIFDYNRVASVQILDGMKDIGGNPVPFALVAIVLVATTLLYLAGKLAFGRSHYAMMAKATHAGGARRLPWPRALGCSALFAGVLGLAVLPHVGVILVAFSNDWYATVLPQHATLRNFELALGHDLTVSAIANSLKYASLATIVDLVLGIAIAWVVVRSRLRLRHVLDALAMLPLAVPGLVLAFGYLAMTQEGRAFAFLNPVADPTALLVIAYSVRRLPYVVRSAAAGFQQTSETLEEAAQNLGAPPLRATLRITLPLITANLIAGALMAFAFAMLEVSDSLILAQKQIHYPITKAIFDLFQLIGDGKYLACALGVWAMVFLGVAIVALGVLLGKKLGAIFRV